MTSDNDTFTCTQFSYAADKLHTRFRSLTITNTPELKKDTFSKTDLWKYNKIIESQICTSLTLDRANKSWDSLVPTFCLREGLQESVSYMKDFWQGGREGVSPIMKLSPSIIFLFKNDFYPLDGAKLSKFYNDYLVLCV